jgi:leader peptidase (prepilin peptidase)/N-methyltransferase
MDFGSPRFWEVWASPAVLGLLGLLIGSFLNVVIHRLPQMLLRDWWKYNAENLDDAAEWKLATGAERPAAYARVGQDIHDAIEARPRLGLVTPRSRCGECGHQIRWYENIPVVSWLALRGRCSACKTRISIRYPIVEIATGLLFAGAAWRFGPSPLALAWCAMLATLLAAAMIDLDTKYLPDVLVQPILWSGLILATLGWNLPWPTALWGAVAGYMSLWTISKLYELLRGVPGMGDGDFRLLAALCAWLGWQALLPIVLMASVVGLCVHVPLRLAGGTDAGQRLPFGPFLAGGGVAVMFLGVDRVLGWINVSLPS